jgi:hypothetical protein
MIIRKYPSPLFLLISLLALTCAKIPDNNPLWEGYKGDYSLSVAWKSLPDTLVTNYEYAISCTTGTDSFVDSELLISRKL